MPAISLEDLQQQIAQRERELQALREELESRQSQFTELTRRKQELQRQLRQVEEEIAALAADAPTEAEQSEPVAPARPGPASAETAGGQPRLGELIVTVLRDSGTPMTARQLCEETQRRGYQSTSRDPIKSVEARLQDLKIQGVVRRASGQPGYVLAHSANGARQEKSKPSQPARPSVPKAAAKPAKPATAAKKSDGKGSAPTAKPGHRGGQPPLREVLTGILKNSRKPLSGSELAERALATGYQSNSKNFVDAVWAMLGQMDNVEHLPQKGYRLKRT